MDTDKIKIGSLGDIHGRVIWKDIISSHSDVQHWVFVGDYTDSYFHTDDQIINNLLDIITWKKAEPDRYTLLLGNHDIQYAYYPQFGCSGWRPTCSHLLQSIFEENKDLFEIAYQHENYLWTHAGVCQSWLKKIEPEMRKSPYNLKEDYSNIAEVLNKMNKTHHQPFLHSIGRARGGYNLPGVTWADRNEALQGIPKGLHQIVGHTPIKKVTTYTKISGTEHTDRSITFIDALTEAKDKIPDFYIIEI